MPEWTTTVDDPRHSGRYSLTRVGDQLSGTRRAAWERMDEFLKKIGKVRLVLVAAIVPIMLFVSLASWAFASPVGSSPDDDYHMASIWCAGGTNDLCREGQTATERRVPYELLSASGCYAFRPTESAACPPVPMTDLRNTSRGNFDGSYPPVFYTTMSMFAGPDIPVSILLMRVFNALLFVGGVTALFLVLPGGRRGPLLWGLAATIIPLGMFIIPSVNPSSWAVFSAATLWIALLAYFRADSRPRRIASGALAVLATVMGAGARSDSAVYAGVAIVIVAILSFERSRKYALMALLPAILLIVAVGFFFASGQSAVVDPGAAESAPSAGAQLGLVLANLVLLPGLYSGALGTTGLGWLDTAMPASVWVSTLAVFFSFVFWGIRRIDRRKALALALALACLVVIPLYIMVKDGVMVGTGVQPRYIYPLLIMLAGIALLGFRRDDLGLGRLQLGIVALLLALANAVALHTNIRRYVTGTDSNGPNLNKNIEWWWQMPLSPMAVWIIGSVAFGIAMLGIFVYARRSSAVEARTTGEERPVSA